MVLWFRRRNDGGSEDAVEEARSPITPGVPGRCPECDGLGYIDHADLVYHTQVQHCRDCGHRWEYTFDEDGALVEVLDLRDQAAPRAKVRVADVGDDETTLRAGRRPR